MHDSPFTRGADSIKSTATLQWGRTVLGLNIFMQWLANLEENKNTDFFKKSDRILIDWILKNPQKTTHLSIKGLSLITKVSEPSIIRFCRRAGAKGYTDFKLKLTENLALGQVSARLDLDSPIELGALRNHVLDHAKQALTECKLELSEAAISYVVYLLNQASSLLIISMGRLASSLTQFYFALLAKMPKVAQIKNLEELNFLSGHYFNSSVVVSQDIKKTEPTRWCLLVDDGSDWVHMATAKILESGYRLFVLTEKKDTELEKKADIVWAFSVGDEILSRQFSLETKWTATLELLKQAILLNCSGRLMNMKNSEGVGLKNQEGETHKVSPKAKNKNIVKTRPNSRAEDKDKDKDKAQIQFSVSSSSIGAGGHEPKKINNKKINNKKRQILSKVEKDMDLSQGVQTELW